MLYFTNFMWTLFYPENPVKGLPTAMTMEQKKLTWYSWYKLEGPEDPECSEGGQINFWAWSCPCRGYIFQMIFLRYQVRQKPRGNKKEKIISQNLGKHVRGFAYIM